MVYTYLLVFLKTVFIVFDSRLSFRLSANGLAVCLIRGLKSSGTEMYAKEKCLKYYKFVDSQKRACFSVH